MTAVFDFDKTLTDKDTALGFVREFVEPRLLCWMKFIAYLGVAVLGRLRLVSNTFLKRTTVYLFFKGIPTDIFCKKAAEYSEKIKLNDVYQDHFLAYADPIIITASFEEYIRPRFSATRVIGSQVSVHDGVVSHLGRNCHGAVKETLLRGIGVDEIDVLFTDSVQDLPLARMSKQIFLVRPGQVIRCRDLDHFLSLVCR